MNKNNTDLIKVTATCGIDPRDKGIKILMKEYVIFKKNFITKVKGAIRPIVKDRNVRVYSSQKFLLEKKLHEFVKNLPYHPMPTGNQAYWLEKSYYETKNGKKYPCINLHIKTKDGEAVSKLIVPKKYEEYLLKATKKSCPYLHDEKCEFEYCPFETPKMCKKINPHRGELELIEDLKSGYIRAHITLRFPKSKPYEPTGWLGVDTGWNKLAVSIVAKNNPHLRFYAPSIHGKDFKTRIIQLRHKLKELQRNGKVSEVWENRLQNMIKYATGKTAKEIVSKAKKYRVGVAMEDLNFQAVTKGFIVPRYKLMIAIKTHCEREAVPFVLVPAKNTSITCPKCGFVDEKNRNGERFKCLKCGYEADADIVGAMNISKAGVKI